MGPRVSLFACLLLLGLAGCGTADREDDAHAVAERFHAAVAEDDGRAACDELGEETAATLERQEEAPCEEAILRIPLPAADRVSFVDVEMRSAEARLAGGGSAFLNESPRGWEIAAAGCRPTIPERPYECELED